MRLAHVILIVFVFAVCVSMAAHSRSSPRSERPNIILFLVDDMGWQDTSVAFHTRRTPFNDRYRTPNMERLAGRGMTFTRGYATPVCSPTRVSLMTGLNAARHRVTNWTLRRDQSTDARHARLTFPKWNVNGLSPEAGVDRTVHARSLPSFLQAAGYRTIHVGKAHFGAIDTPGEDPLNLGFDVNIAGHAAGAPASYLGSDSYASKQSSVWDVPGLEKYHGTHTHLTDALTIEARAAMRDAVDDDKPFFLYMAHYAVHTPIQRDERFVASYQGLHPTEAAYASMIEGMDKSFGDLLDEIDALGVANDTIILFMSDNGGLSAHARGGERHTHNAPLKSGKGSAHEGGTRVPMIVVWPGATQPASRTDVPVIIEDFFPTVLAMAGVETPSQIGGVIDGLSFVDVLRGDATDDRSTRPFIWHYPNQWGGKGPGIGSVSSIVLGDWKLIYYHDPERSERFELYDLVTDLSETENLADEQPDTMRQLADRLQRELIRMNAQMPTLTATGETIDWPGDALVHDPDN